MYNYIAFFCIAQSNIFGFLFLRKKQYGHAANKLLAFLLISIGYSILPLLFSGIERNAALSVLLKVSPNMRFLFGPLLYLYTKKLLYKEYRITAKILLHFIPFHVFWVSLAYFGYRDFAVWTAIKLISTYVLHIQILIYCVSGLYLLQQYKLLLKNRFSSIEKMSFTWLKFLIIYFAVSFIALLTLTVAEKAETRFPELFKPDSVAALIVTAFSVAITGFVMNQPEIFNNAASSKPEKYEGSGLSSTEVVNYFAELEQLMKKEQPYMDEELNIKKLANLCGIPDYNLSRVINEGAGASFFDYINDYRIERSKKILADPKSSGYTILRIAFDSGFNSKSAFYRAFRKKENMSPVEYRKTGSPPQ